MTGLEFGIKYRNSRNCLMRGIAKFLIKYAKRMADREERKLLDQGIRQIDPEEASRAMKRILEEKETG